MSENLIPTHMRMDSLKDAALSIWKIGDEIADALEDGKVSFSEGLQIAGTSIVNVPTLIVNSSDIFEALKQLDSQGIQEIGDHLKKEADIDDPDFFNKLLKGVNLLYSVYTFIRDFKS